MKSKVTDRENDMLTAIDEVRQGQSMDLSSLPTEELRKQLKISRKAFKEAGGRGVELAEFIDCARFELRSRSSRKAAQTRKANRA